MSQIFKLLTDAFYNNPEMLKGLASITFHDDFMEKLRGYFTEDNTLQFETGPIPYSQNYHIVDEKRYSKTNLFNDWIPCNITLIEDEFYIDWCINDGGRFTEPFFEQTIARIHSKVIHRYFRIRTKLNILEYFANSPETLTPAGFIFHTSRCGSTLVSQMLASVPSNIAISEAPAIDTLLTSNKIKRMLSEETRKNYLHAIINLYGRKTGSELNYFIKFDCWHITQYNFIKEIFPNVPTVFLYRDPAEVLVSLKKQPGIQIIPQIVKPSIYGFDDDIMNKINHPEYTAMAIGRIYEYGLANFMTAKQLVINYNRLPQIVFDVLLKYFKTSYSPEDTLKMNEASKRNAKITTEIFENDSAYKQNMSTPEIKELAEKHINKFYLELNQLQDKFTGEV